MLKDVDGDGNPEFWNVLDAVPSGDRWTNWWDKDNDGKFGFSSERSLLDHILVSNSLRPLVEAVGIEHGHDPTSVSDHWPMWVRLDLSSLLPTGGPERSAINR